MSLSQKAKERYSRQIKLPQVGEKGQKKISRARVLVVGCGGLGSPAALYLAAAGVGRIGLVDSDRVELNNLHRQFLHTTRDMGRPKVASAKARIIALNPEVEVKTHKLRLAPENILEIIRGYDIIADGSDNFPTRYLINDACVLADKPFSHASVFGFEGQALTVIPKKGPCYRCLYPQPPPATAVSSCRRAGVLGAVAGILGAVQANEILKLILRVGRPLTGRLLIFNGLDSTFKTVAVRRQEDCPVCSRHPTIKSLIDYEEFCRGQE
jgi:sulfur-carrier protein adenylyltransferase/sulfurtransferase